MDLKKYFSKYFNKETLIKINTILKNEKLNDEQKKKLINILAFLSDGSSLGDDIYDLVISFCSDEENINNKYFDELLDTINGLIKGSRDDKLASRVKTILHGSKSKLDLPINKYYLLLISILSMKKFEYDYDNHEIISNLLDNPIEGYPERTKQAIEIALDNEVSILSLSDSDGWNRGDSTLKFINSILRNKTVLELDNTYFEKAVKIAYNNIQAGVLDKAINTEGLTEEKIKAIIDYYYVILNKYLQLYFSCGNDTVDKDGENIVYSVVISDKFMKMDDETYKNTLEKIKKSNVPFSLARALSSDELTTEQQKILLDVLEGVTVVESENFIKGRKVDYKNPVVEAAMSPVLRAQLNDEYARILKIIDKYSIDLELNFQSKKYDSKKSDLLSYKIWGIINLLNQESFIENYELFNYLLDKVISSDQSKIKAACEFASNEFVKYYSDYEITRIFNMILDSQRYWTMRSLFTNKNVPYMSIMEKMHLFAVAETDDEEKMEKLIEKLNEEGEYNNNKYAILDGVNDKLIKKLGLKYPKRNKTCN